MRLSWVGFLSSTLCLRRLIPVLEGLVVHDAFKNDTTNSSGNGLYGIVTNEMPLFLGDNPEATGRFFDGTLDEIKIFDRTLSAEEIGNLAGL